MCCGTGFGATRQRRRNDRKICLGYMRKPCISRSRRSRLQKGTDASFTQSMWETNGPSHHVYQLRQTRIRTLSSPSRDSAHSTASGIGDERWDRRCRGGARAACGAGRNVTLGMMGGHVVQGSRGVARAWMGGQGKDQAALRLNNRRSAFILSVTLARSADMMGARVASCPLCSFLRNLKALRLDCDPSVTHRGAPQIERQRVLPHGTELPARKTSSPPSARGLQY